jgi:hypothetical protein
MTDLTSFVSKTIAEHLKTYRPLEIWEQFALVYYSEKATVTEKRAGLALLLKECGGAYPYDYIRQAIKEYDGLFRVMRAESVPKRIFVVNISVFASENITYHTREYSPKNTFDMPDDMYFSTYHQAFQWLNKRLRKLRSLVKADKEASLDYCDIEQLGLDKRGNQCEAVYLFDWNSKLIYARKYTSKFPCLSMLIENAEKDRHIELGHPFELGDIVFFKRTMCNYGGYGIVREYCEDHYRGHTGPTGALFPRVKLFTLDDNGLITEYSYCGYTACDEREFDFYELPITELELPDKIPGDMFPLVEARLHMLGKHRLSDERLRQIDPKNYLYQWRRDNFWRFETLEQS